MTNESRREKPRPPRRTPNKPGGNNPRAADQNRPAPRPGARMGWDAVAGWYDGWVGKGGSEHHRKLAIPSVMRLLALKKGESLLDIGCGQGVLAEQARRGGAAYTGVDVSPRLLEMARKHHKDNQTRFVQADACRLAASKDLKAGEFDAAVFLLSIQDINPLDEALTSAAWALKPGGRLVMLMTHPCFRIPRQSGWGYDENRKLNYRRVDRYLTPLPVPMKAYGGGSGTTMSFHRPLHEYVNGLAAPDVGMMIDHMDEITTYKADEGRISDKTLAEAEREFPLFMALRARKLA